MNRSSLNEDRIGINRTTKHHLVLSSILYQNIFPFGIKIYSIIEFSAWMEWKFFMQTPFKALHSTPERRQRNFQFLVIIFFLLLLLTLSLKFIRLHSDELLIECRNLKTGTKRKARESANLSPAHLYSLTLVHNLLPLRPFSFFNSSFFFLPFSMKKVLIFF